MTPAGAEIMRENGYQVPLEAYAGAGSGFSDQGYRTAGAEIVEIPAEI